MEVSTSSIYLPIWGGGRIVIVRRGRIVRVLRVATTWMSRYGGGSRSCESGHGPFAYMQYTPLCDTSRDARVEINDDIFNFVDFFIWKGEKGKEKNRFAKERERERKTKKSFIERKWSISNEAKGKFERRWWKRASGLNLPEKSRAAFNSRVQRDRGLGRFIRVDKIKGTFTT